MTFSEYHTNNGAKIFAWDMPDKEVFFVKFSFFFNNKTLPTDYNQCLNVLGNTILQQLSVFSDAGGNIGFSAGQATTSFYCELPNEYLDQVLAQFSKILTNQTVSNNDYAQGLAICRSNMTKAAQSKMRAIQLLIRSAIVGPLIDSSNDVESINKINIDTVRKLCCDLITPENLRVFMVGDLGDSADKLTSNIEKVLPNGEQPGDQLMIPLERCDWESRPYLTDRTTKSDGQVVFDYEVVLPNKLDRTKVVAYSILRYFLNSNESDSFFNSYRSKKLAYTLFTESLAAFVPGVSLYHLHGVARNNNVDEIIQLFKNRLERLVEQKDFIASHIEAYKEAYNNNLIITSQTPYQLVMQGYTQYCDFGDVRNDATANQISADDIGAAIRDILNPAKELLFKIDYK